MAKHDGVTDQELAVRYMEGDCEAFDTILERHKGSVFSHILSVVQDQDVADDLFQDVFVKVIMKLRDRKYAPTGSFSYWLARVTSNVIMDWYRGQKCEPFIEPTPDNDLSNLSESSVLDTSREDELVHAQVLKDARKLMEALPPEQREVVYMRIYQNISFKEIAEITGVSINTSLGRMRYALINMRKMAEKHDLALKIS